MPYLLSKKCFVSASLIAMIGYLRSPEAARLLRRITPVVVSSVPPTTSVKLVGPGRVQDCNEVRAVVHGDVRPVVQRRLDVAVVGVPVFALDGKGRDAILGDQRRRDVVLSTQRIACAHRDTRSAVSQSQHQVGSFCCHVETGGHSQPVEGLFIAEALPYLPDDRHLPGGPTRSCGLRLTPANCPSMWPCSVLDVVNISSC